jgi:uncharacterized membrane protein YkoI
MINLNLHRRPATTMMLVALIFGLYSLNVRAQSNDKPLTSQELVQLVYQLPTHPEMRDQIVEEIRKRGIGFALTNGLLSIVATKSGNDALLRRTLEEAERRRLNPTTSVLPSEAEASDILAKTRNITLAAAEAMPDFIVRQRITRSYARGNTENWIVADHLTVAVSYRVSAGEQYKLLTINGLPPDKDAPERNDYTQAGGTSSTGEYVSQLTALFAAESRTSFKVVDTDLLRGHRAVVYEYEIQKPYSTYRITADADRSVISGYRGRVWLDRENYRVLRIESIATTLPPDFPITASSRLVDYDWVTIAEHQYLLPSFAEIKMTHNSRGQVFQSRNEIRFRNYQKFGSEVKIIEDDIIDDETEEKKP